ncbi:alpha/beta hydrolase [Kineosporia sp. NBRC 101731]|uniref:alpha/beta hydrolase n=1 Tax=Kineosporia sp. NBRC 101731 TaxID=3032199 RepID=UPI0024A2C5BF|nr:alpha/beta hydrolase [Kineosporia sp. NBRC 101731]GLY28895.1 hypothetical protein Kisp02_22600 [Kineosporia sp. NBRC 101731]
MAVPVVVATVLIGGLYVFPLRSARLQQAEPHTLSFAEATAAASVSVERDTADDQVLPECRSLLRVHPEKTTKSVLMLHGYTSCPKDYVRLAEMFYERGYNVYAPREPHHGLTDADQAQQVSTDRLADYADAAMDVAAGLGEETGVIGLSGGAVLATWLAEIRTESVSHLLVLSPFYRPNSSQAPSFVVRPLILLYGFRLLPNRRVGDTNFTLSGLAQYLRVTRNLRDNPVSSKLRTVAVAVSANDSFIDRDTAEKIPTEIGDANELKTMTHEFGPEMGLDHNIVNPDALGEHADEVLNLYLDLYEGN